MVDITDVLRCLDQCLSKTTVRQLERIVPAMLAMTGRVTMLGISRWTGQGGSYRTVQRFFNTVIVWSQVQWFFIRHHLLDPEDSILIAGDETVVTKSGHKTYGLDRFFSSLYGRPVPGIAFFGLSLISIKHRVSHPVMMEQVIKAAPEKQETKPSKSAKKQEPKKRPPGRPKGARTETDEMSSCLLTYCRYRVCCTACCAWLALISGPFTAFWTVLLVITMRYRWFANALCI